jgi:Zn ribbon nucleic-acid-binding protein
VKNSSECPKCHSEDILKIWSYPASNRRGDSIPFGPWIFSDIPVTRYLCCSCGFTEEWIDSTDDIQNLKQQYG